MLGEIRSKPLYPFKEPTREENIESCKEELVEYLRESRGLTGGIANDISELATFTDMCYWVDEMDKVMELLVNLAESLQEK
jgi:hypothetical protein